MPNLNRMHDFQKKMNDLFNESLGKTALVLELIGSLLVACICVLYVVSTYVSSEHALQTIHQVEAGIMALFFLEYCMRWWAKGFSFRSLLSPLALIDLISFLPLFLPANIQFVRVLRLLRILRIHRYIRRHRFLSATFTELRIQVIQILFTITCIIFISSGLMYEFEHHDAHLTFRTFFDAVYFSIVTLTTVGYGDVVPLPEVGRAIALLIIASGVLLIPWQVATLMRLMGKKMVTCKRCGLSRHDVEAVYCKACGLMIYQEYEGV